MNDTNNDTDNSQYATSNQSTSDSSAHENSPTHIHIDVRDSNDLDLGPIQEETNLIQYTDSHFTHITNNDLHKLRNDYKHANNDCSIILQNNITRCDSPMTISNYGSRSASSNNSDCDADTSTNNSNIRKQISLDDISNTNFSLKTITKRNRKHNTHKRASKFKQLAFHDVEKTLDKYYDMESLKYSTSIEIKV